jgi:hypothetical protein
VENAAPVEIRKERGFPQGAWKAKLSTFPTSASLFLSRSKTQRNNYRGRCIERDPKLKRDIAIKVLPDTMGEDPERRARDGSHASVRAIRLSGKVSGLFQGQLKKPE